jgi:hypothetical protein
MIIVFEAGILGYYQNVLQKLKKQANQKKSKIIVSEAITKFFE